MKVNMNRLSLYVGGIALAAALAFTGYSYVVYREDAWEASVLKSAYESRTNYDAAVKAYSAAFGSLRKSRHIALFNLGTITIYEALRTQNGNLLISAIDYLRQSLRDKPDFFEAKKNLELAERYLEAAKKNGKGKGEGEDESGGKDQTEKDQAGKKPGVTPYAPVIP